MRNFFYKAVLMLALSLLMGQTYGKGWEEPPPLRDRLFFGGNFGLTFGNTTSIIVSPLAGYRITPKLSGGLGVRYEYYKNSYPGFVPYSTNIYGGSVFTRYMLIQNLGETLGIGGIGTGIFIQGEYEMLNLESQYFDVSNTHSQEKRFNLHSVLVGGGIYQPIGQRSGFLITVLWNLNESLNSVYSNPLIRLGFTF